MPTIFGICLMLGLVATSDILSQLLFRWEKKQKIPTTNRLATGAFIFLILALLTCLVGHFVGPNNDTVKPTAWKTLYPNQDDITMTLKTKSNRLYGDNKEHTITVSKNLSRDDIKNLISIRLNQDKAVKETDIDDVVITGQGSTLDHITYGIETKAVYLFGQRVFKDDYQVKTLKIIYKDSDSNKTLDNLLD